MTMTPAERANLDRNRVAVDEQLDELMWAWKHLRDVGADPDLCLVGVTNALLGSLPSRVDLLRLVAGAVQRLAELPAVTQ